MCKKLKSLHNMHLILIFFILLFGFYVFHQPRLKSRFFPEHRNNLLHKLISNSIEEQKINPQELWKFRDFYYAGSIILYEKHPELVNEILTEFNKEVVSTLLYEDLFFPYLTYNSELILSIEGYSKVENLSIFVEEEIKDSKSKTILSNSKNLILQNNLNEIIFITLNPLEKAAQANGYLWFTLREDNYSPPAENWLTVTKIKK